METDQLSHAESLSGGLNDFDTFSDEEFVNRFKSDFLADVEARRPQHKKNNYHYLQYKSILWLNNVYGEEYLKSIGLQVFVPRTFMTIEAIRPYLSGRTLDLKLSSETMKSRPSARKAERMLRGEWERAGADWAKSDAEFYALLLGTGFLLTRFIDDKFPMPIYDGMDDDGKVKWKDGDFQRYKGLKLFSLNPWYTFPDRTATSNENAKHYFLYSMWDFDEWKDYCKRKGFNTYGMVKGGLLEEFDAVRRKVDVLYGALNVDLRTRDNGTLISNVPIEKMHIDTSNKIMVVERFSPTKYSVVSGANWTLNYRDENPDPDKTISIQTVRDVHIPDEFDGMGEAEIIRWQQYEENKVHNLSYMSTLIGTLPRYGIMENMLVDPTEASFTNPLKWIRLKNVPGNDVNKAMMLLNQKSTNDVPLNFLQRIDTIRQEISGISSYITSSPDSQVDTLGEANMMKLAGMERIRQKVYEIEERDLVPILRHWLTCFPQYYTEEMDTLLGFDEDNDDFVKFLPYDREFNNDAKTIGELSGEYGIMDATSIEDLYMKLGYKDVVFASDLVGYYRIRLKTATAAAEREKTLTELNICLDALIKINNAVQYQAWDVADMGEEFLREFPEIFKNSQKMRREPPQPPAAPGADAMGAMPNVPADTSIGQAMGGASTPINIPQSAAPGIGQPPDSNQKPGNFNGTMDQNMSKSIDTVDTADDENR